MLRQAADHRAGRPQGGVQPGAPEDLQARDQAGAQADPQAGVYGRAQGGVHQGQDQPHQEEEARGQEVVLRPFGGVRSLQIMQQ